MYAACWLTLNGSFQTWRGTSTSSPNVIKRPCSLPDLKANQSRRCHSSGHATKHGPPSTERTCTSTINDTPNSLWQPPRAPPRQSSCAERAVLHLMLHFDINTRHSSGTSSWHPNSMASSQRTVINVLKLGANVKLLLTYIRLHCAPTARSIEDCMNVVGACIVRKIGAVIFTRHF